MRTPHSTSLLAAIAAVALALAPAAPGGRAEAADAARSAWPRSVAVIGFRSEDALRAALRRESARVVRRIPALRAAEVRPSGSPERFAAGVRGLPGIDYVQPLRTRTAATEPALQPGPFGNGAYEWQFAATRSDTVPEAILRAAATVTVAVIDTGADLAAPDLAAKTPTTLNIRLGSGDVTDTNGHGTFVASLAAGSVSNGEGMAGFGGDSRLLVIKAGSPEGGITDVEASNAIVYAVDHGAKVINLSFGGPSTSGTEQRAIDYAAARNVLLVAAAGNEFEDGNPVSYPAALLQPAGSNGQGGRGLAVSASTSAGARAFFSNTGSYISLAAPGLGVLSALSSLSAESTYPRIPLPGSRAGLYGFGSGTSFAAPQVAGAAALVWAANPRLRAPDVAAVLKETAQGGGVWSPELGYGVIDVAAAVARAGATVPTAPAVRASATLKLAASRTTGRSPLRTTFTATLRAGSAGVATAGRELVLESFDGRRWTPAARATTTATGQARWRFALSRGSYRARARFAGAEDLGAATSRTLRLTSR